MRAEMRPTAAERANLSSWPFTPMQPSSSSSSYEAAEPSDSQGLCVLMYAQRGQGSLAFRSGVVFGTF